MKTVFTNTMCAHVWAHLRQPHGRSDSMRFDGSLAYSYAEPVAHIVKTKSGLLVALFTNLHFSQTTQRHIGSYRTAASHYPQFIVPDIFRHRYELDDTCVHDLNIVHFKTVYARKVAKLLKTNSDSYYVKDPHYQLRAVTSIWRDYCDIFRVPFEQPPVSEDAQKIIARRDRLSSDPKAIAKRAVAEAKRAVAEVERMAGNARRTAEAVEQFRSGRGWGRSVTDAAGGALLRVTFDKVETSLGATIPLEDAARAIRFIRTVQAKGILWERGDGQFPVGQFQIDAINPDGLTRAGCHVISFAEIDAIGKKLGV